MCVICIHISIYTHKYILCIYGMYISSGQVKEVLRTPDFA